MTSAHLDDDQWADEPALSATTESPVEPEDETPPLRFPTLPVFVTHLADLYRREVFDSSERAWCPEWWEHPEAIARLEAMWRGGCRLVCLRCENS